MSLRVPSFLKVHLVSQRFVLCLGLLSFLVLCTRNGILGFHWHNYGTPVENCI
uniref:Uncharacterized protein n=1 Tax=Anguilla anguilla TaxID=7936 RepID=A0A0E9V6Z2_ANGAN